MEEGRGVQPVARLPPQATSVRADRNSELLSHSSSTSGHAIWRSPSRYKHVAWCRHWINNVRLRCVTVLTGGWQRVITVHRADQLTITHTIEPKTLQHTLRYER